MSKEGCGSCALRSGEERAVTLRITEKEKGHRDAFSSAPDFAGILIPSFLGVAYMLFHDGFSSEKFLVYGLFLFGMGSALALLRGMEKVESLNL
jgi:hypothetical protein